MITNQIFLNENQINRVRRKLMVVINDSFQTWKIFSITKRNQLFPVNKLCFFVYYFSNIHLPKSFAAKKQSLYMLLSHLRVANMEIANRFLSVVVRVCACVCVAGGKQTKTTRVPISIPVVPAFPLFRLLAPNLLLSQLFSGKVGIPLYC